MNKRGPNAEPWGTPWCNGDENDLMFFICTNCFLSERYELNHFRAVPVTPVPAKRSSKTGCDMVSKAALRSRRMRMERRPESAARRRSLVILTRAVSVLCLEQKPDWNGSNRLLF